MVYFADKWATDFLSHAPPQKTLEEEEIVSEETTEMPSSNSKVDISKKKSEQIVPLLKGSKTSVTSDAESKVDPEGSPMKKIKADWNVGSTNQNCRFKSNISS